ncbi:c-type cytochrome [Pseudomonas fulva]|nr:cytochrome c [Pseudomonas fulva]
MTLTAVPPELNSAGTTIQPYLTNALAHCSTCHTPRNMMMGEKTSVALSGSPLGGWYAPNITPDPISGIGQWSEEEIAAYVKTGRAVGKAQAAGPMAEAVEHSFRHLTDDDLAEIARYIKSIPGVSTPHVQHAAFSVATAKPAERVNIERDISHNPYHMSDGSSTDGERLYVGACATCHQIAGQGTQDQFYPSLTSNSAVGSFLPANLVMAIVEGVHRETNDYAVSMPAFKDEFTNEQTAAVATYVMQRFGHSQATVTADQVALYRAGGEKPFIVKYVGWMMAGGVLIAVAILLILGRIILRGRAQSVAQQI